jgi:hypothetical protein
VSIDIDTQWGMRSFELWYGDVTNLDFVVELLVISAVETDYSPLSGTVVGALSNRLGISVERLSAVTELDWSVQPCVRPLSAVYMTAGHNVLRGSGPDQKLAFDVAPTHVGCADRRIDRPEQDHAGHPA